jgi:hypothetical protein
MNEFSLDTIDDTISRAIEREREIEIEKCDKMYVNNTATKQLKHLVIVKQLLEAGHEVVKHVHGIKVNDKFIIGASGKKWRVDGKAKWYWYSEKSFTKALEQ